jgi:acyl carrier protein
MTRADIVEKINHFLTDEFEIEENEIKEDAHLIDDLGIESLDFVDIVAVIERDFKFKVVREDITQMRTLKDLYDYIERNIK